MRLKFLPTRILRKREVPFKRRLFNSKLKTKQLATAIPVELILIIVILVLLLGSVAAAVVDADEVFGSTHCSATCGIFALNGTAAHAGTLSVHQSHTGVVYGPRTR